MDNSTPAINWLHIHRPQWVCPQLLQVGLSHPEIYPTVSHAQVRPSKVQGGLKDHEQHDKEIEPEQ